jgi:hypothetical protein
MASLLSATCTVALAAASLSVLTLPVLANKYDPEQIRRAKAYEERHGNAVEAKLIEQRPDGLIVVRGVPRFRLRQHDGSWMTRDGRSAPGPMMISVRIKVWNQVCHSPLMFQSSSGLSVVDHEKEHKFLVSPGEGPRSPCVLLRMWDDEGRSFDWTKPGS